MNQYPQEYYVLLSGQYQAMQWQGILGTLMGVVMLVAMGAWAFSLVKKSLRARR